MQRLHTFRPRVVLAIVLFVGTSGTIVGAQRGTEGTVPSVPTPLSGADLQHLAQFSPFWLDPDTPLTHLDPARQRDIAAAGDRARAAFAGRAAAIAKHFLEHTDYQAPNEAYWFVMGALADPEAAILMIRALPEPPPVQAGVLERDQGEISIAIATMLAAPALAEDEAVSRALVAATEVRTALSGPPDRAAELLGRARTPLARAALQRLLQDPEPSVRVAAAQALGRDAATLPPAANTIAGLVAVLHGDLDPDARIAAARTLGETREPDAVAALSTALDRETEPRVVDALLAALDAAGAPITDPARCRDAIARALEPQAARACFERWRRSADAAALLEMAERGAPVPRIMAIEALLTPPARQQIARPLETAPPALDPELRARLLASLGDLLAMPRPSNWTTVAYMAHEALWAVSGHDVAVALPYADRAEPRATRFAASKQLAMHDPDAYARARRPRDMSVALVVVALSLALALVQPLRPAAFCLALSAVVWGLWMMTTSGVRDLPPPPWYLTFLTVPAITLFASAVVSGAALSLQQAQRLRLGTSAVLFIASTLMSGVVALAIAVSSRTSGVFPSSNEGWDTIFETLAAAVLACVWSALLLAAAALGRRFRSSPPDAVPAPAS